jgi:hypothetical protein
MMPNEPHPNLDADNNYKLEFYVYEELGPGLQRRPEHSYAKDNLFTTPESLQVGDTAYTTGLFGECWEFVVESVSGNSATLKSKTGVMCTASFETKRYDGPHWVGMAFGDMRGLERVEFT